MQGRDVRRPPVHPRGLLRLRRRHAAVRRRAGGQGRLPHRQLLVLLPRLRARVRPTPVGLTRARAQPRRVPRARRDYTVVPVWRELLADLITPVAAFARLCRDDEPGFLLESVEHGERWSRWSFVGRRAAATLRRRAAARSTVDQRRARRRSRSTRASSPRSRPCSSATGRRSLDELPPLHGGLIGYLGYDVVREVEHLPDVPDRRPGLSRRGAVDHRRAGRVRPLPPARHPDRQRVRSRPTPSRRRARPGLRRGRRPARPARRSTAPARSTSRWSSRPRVDDELPEVHVVDGRRAPTAGRSRWPRSTSSPATSSRSCWRSASTSSSTPTRSTSTACCARSTRARTCTSCACPSSRWSARSPEPMVQLLDGRVISRPIAGTRRRGRTDEEDRRLGRRAERAPQGDRRARHAGRPGPQRRRPGRALRHRAGRRDDDARALQPRDAPHVAGVGRAGRGPHADRRAAGHAAGRHRVGRAEGAGHGDHRRARAGQARALRRRGRLHRLLGQHRHRHRHPHDGGRRRRPGVGAGRRRASWPTACPSTRTSSATTRPRPCSPPCPAPGA